MRVVPSCEFEIVGENYICVVEKKKKKKGEERPRVCE